MTSGQDDQKAMSPNHARWGIDSSASDSVQNVLLDGDGVIEYEQNMRFFASLLTELNVNVYVAERIFDFPVRLFLGSNPENTIFLSQVVDNFLEASVLLITKLVVDQGPDIHSLRAFRNRLMQIVRPEFKPILSSRLREAALRKTGDELLRRLENLRDRRIAHHLHDFFHEVFEARVSQDRVDFEELKTLRDELNTVFNALSIDSEYILLPLGYDPGHSDIERFLDAVARASDVLNMPERHGEFWQAIRSGLTPQDMAQLNKYRKKFDLPEV